MNNMVRYESDCVSCGFPCRRMIIELVKELRELQDNLEIDCCSIRELNDICKKAADTIEELSAKVEELYCNNRWIPVEERLPEDGQRVFATHLGGLNHENQVIEHVFRDGKFIFNWDMDRDFSSPTFGERYMGEVIAWQPFPLAYEPKED